MPNTLSLNHDLKAEAEANTCSREDLSTERQTKTSHLILAELMAMFKSAGGYRTWNSPNAGKYFVMVHIRPPWSTAFPTAH